MPPCFLEEGVGDLEPDIAVFTDFSDQVVNRDAALEAIYAEPRRRIR